MVEQLGKDEGMEGYHETARDNQDHRSVPEVSQQGTRAE
jgi:hypothetical protein